MLIDSNLVLWEGDVKTATGKEIALNSLAMPGMAEPIPIQLRVTETMAGATSVAVKLQQASAKGGSYADVPDSTVTIAVAECKKGMRVAWRYLPMSVTNPWIRVSMTLTGTATAGKMFCALMREDAQPQQAGTYINKGVVRG